MVVIADPTDLQVMSQCCEHIIEMCLGLGNVVMLPMCDKSLVMCLFLFLPVPCALFTDPGLLYNQVQQEQTIRLALGSNLFQNDWVFIQSWQIPINYIIQMVQYTLQMKISLWVKKQQKRN